MKHHIRNRPDRRDADDMTWKKKKTKRCGLDSSRGDSSMSFEPLSRLPNIRAMSFRLMSVLDHPLPLTTSQGSKETSDGTAAADDILLLLQVGFITRVHVHVVHVLGGFRTVALRGAFFPAFALRRLEVITVFAPMVVVVILMVIVVVRRAALALTLVPFARMIGVCAMHRVPLAMVRLVTMTRPHHSASLVSREGRQGEERGEKNEKRAFPACEML